MGLQHLTLRALPLLMIAFVHLSSYGQITGFPYTQGFDSVSPPALPPGWTSTQNRSSNLDDFTTSSSSPRSLPNAILSTNATIEQSLSSPVFDFSGSVPDRLSFYVRRSSSHLARILVEASLDSGRTYSVQLCDSLRNTGQSSYVFTSVVLPQSLRAIRAARFRWRVVPDVGGVTGTLRVDDVSVTSHPTHDLALVRLRVEPELPAEGASIQAFATARNLGLQKAENFSVDFFVDANNDSLPQATELLATAVPSFPLNPADSVELSVQLAPLTAGEKLLIGKLGYMPDQNLSNNQLRTRFAVGNASQTLVINEIMYAPTGSEPEWIELYNTGAAAMNLKGCSISDNNVASRHTIALSDSILKPQGYMLLTKDAEAFLEVHPLVRGPIIMVPGFPTLNNSGDAVVVYDARGAVVDSVSYRPAWGGESGTSLERLDALEASTDSSNWATSQDSVGGTPGRQNSVAVLDFDLRLLRVSVLKGADTSSAQVVVVVQNAGRQKSGPFYLLLYDDRNRDSVQTSDELFQRLSVGDSLRPRDSIRVTVQWDRPAPGIHQVITVLDDPQDLRWSNNTRISSLAVEFPDRSLVVNEIMFAPLAGNAEYIELANMGQFDVDVYGWKIYDRPNARNDTSQILVAKEHRVVYPGELFVIASDSSLLTFFSYLGATEPRLLRILNQGGLNLNNEGDDVILRDATGRLIDSVAYVPAWHNPGVVDPAGRSLEKIRPALTSNDPRNWSTCADRSGGTPGRQNSIYAAVPPPRSRLSVSPNPFSPDGDGRDDFALIHYEIPLEVAVVSLKVFDVRGRLIRRLTNNEPAGTQGTVVWDGRDDERQKARMGIYVLLLEATDERGGAIETAKGVVVLAARL